EEMQWRSVEELRRRCENIQESINRMKELEWTIELFEGRGPPKPVREGSTEDEKMRDVVEVKEKLVDDEAVQMGADDADGEEDENDLDAEDDDEKDMGEDEMDGFIIGDDEVDFHMRDDLLPVFGDG